MNGCAARLGLLFSVCAVSVAGIAAAAGVADTPGSLPLSVLKAVSPLATQTAALGQPTRIGNTTAMHGEMPRGSASGRQEVQALTGGGYGGVIPLNTGDGDFMGSAIARSGDILAVGAINDGTDVSGIDPGTPGNGAVYLYHRTSGGWQQVQKLVADDGASGDSFGFALAISGDRLFVSNNPLSGAPSAVYVFDQSNDVWSQTQELSENPATTSSPNYGFGWSVALDGSRAMISDPTASGGGKVYVFAESGGLWQQTQIINLTNAAPNDPYGVGDGFGWSIALNGSTAVIGALFASSEDGSVPDTGAAYAFNESNGAWSQGDRFAACGLPGFLAGSGYAVALDGSTALVGAPSGSTTTTDYNSAAGIACLYTPAISGWTLAQTLETSDGEPFDQFGAQLAIKDGLAVVDAPLTNQGISPNGNNNGTTTVGTVYVFNRSDMTWSLTDEIVRGGGLYDYDGSAYDRLGIRGVAIDGTAVLAAGSGTTIGYYGNNGVVDIFNFPAHSVFAPTALTLSVVAGATTSRALQIAAGSEGTSLQFRVSDGGALTQMSDESPAEGVGKVFFTCAMGGAVCTSVTGTDSTSWYRRFYFNEYAQVGTQAAVDAVTVGIEHAPGGMPVTINLYTTPHNVPIDTIDPTQLTQIGSSAAVADGSSDTTLNIPVVGSVDDTVGKDLVVEYHVDSYLGLPVFLPGANASPQTHATFIGYGDAGSGQPMFAGNWSHNLISAHLDPVASGIACADAARTPWLGVAPTAGAVDAGASQDLTVSIDATNLAPGHYSTQVCIATKGPLPSMIQVPVDLTVTSAEGDAIFEDGFDAASP